MMNKLQLIGAFVIAFCSVSLLNAQDATITVKPSEDAPTISKHIYGHFAEHLGRSIYDGFFVGSRGNSVPRIDLISSFSKAPCLLCTFIFPLVPG